MIVSDNFPHLSSEIEAIARSWGWADFLSCLEYIYVNRREYEGTACWREFVAFTRQIGLMNVSKEESVYA
jgi:hypothetical protein